MQKRHGLKIASGLVMGSSMMLMTLLPAASAMAATTPAVTSVTLSSEQGTVAVGNTVSFTASATQTGSGTPMYNFWYQGVNGHWHSNGWSSSKSFSLPALQNGSYEVVVYSADKGQTTPASSGAANNTTNQFVNVNSTLKVSTNASDVAPMTPVTITAQSTNLTNAVYQYWIGSPNGNGGYNWRALNVNGSNGDYSTATSATFTPSNSGSYQIAVYAKDLNAPQTAAFSKAQALTESVYGSAAAVKLSAAHSSLVADGQATDTITATVVDSNGNTVANYTGPVTLTDTQGWLVTGTTASGTNTVGSTMIVNAVNGVATFTAQAPITPGVSDVATASGLSGVGNATISYGSQTIQSVPQVATSVVLTGPKSLTANTSGNQGTISAVVKDQNGHAMLTGAYGITLNLTGPATFADGTTGPEYLSFQGDNNPGNANPATATIDSVGGSTGTVSISGTSTGLTSGSLNVGAVIGGPATHLGLTSNVSSFVEGSGNQATLTVSQLDANGNTAASGTESNAYTAVVTQNGQPASNVTINGTAVDSTGSASFTGSSFTFAANNTNADAGTYQIVVKDNNANGSLATSAPVSETITPNTSAANETYSFGASSTQVSAANPTGTLKVQLTDQYGNPLPLAGAVLKVDAAPAAAGAQGTVTINGQAASGTNASNVTNEVAVTTNSQGVATLNFAAQPYSGSVWNVNVVSAKNASGNNLNTGSPSSESVGIVTTGVTHVVTSMLDTSAGNYHNSASGAIAGDNVSLTIKAEDQYNNPVNNDTVVVTPSSGLDLSSATYASGTALTPDPNISGAYDVTLTNGEATISGIVAKGAGSQTIKVQDVTAPTTPSTTQSLNVVAGSFAGYAVFDQNGNLLTSNSSSSNQFEDFASSTKVPVVVKAVDQYGNPVAAPYSADVNLITSGTGEFRLPTSASDLTGNNVLVPAGSAGVTVDYINDTSSASYDNLTAKFVASGVAATPSVSTAYAAATPTTNTLTVKTGASASGTIDVTVNSTVVPVAVASGASAATVAGDIATALTNNSTVSGAYTIANPSSGDTVTLTQKVASSTAINVTEADASSSAATSVTTTDATTTTYAAATPEVYNVAINSGATYDGQLTVVTKAGSTTVSTDTVNVTAGETAAQVATAIASTLQGDSAVTNVFTVKYTTGAANFTLTQNTASSNATDVTVNG